jgi:2-dehydropantoate 2-reductase
MNSLIVGPGAIGTLVCAHIQTFSQVYVHPHRANLNLATDLVTGTACTKLDWAVNPSINHQIDIIWVSCKAGQVLRSTSLLLEQHPTAIAILLHNGLGPQDILKANFKNRVLLGSTTCGALKTAEQEYTQTSFGQTDICFESDSKHARSFKDTLVNPNNNKGPLKIHSNENLTQILWKKLLINACINPLTAYYNIKNGGLLDPKFKPEIELICSEVNSIMTHKGIETIVSPVDVVLNVAKISSENWSSMAVDFKARRETEIDYINGYLINQAAELNLRAPTLKKWYKRIATETLSCQSN